MAGVTKIPDPDSFDQPYLINRVGRQRGYTNGSVYNGADDSPKSQLLRLQSVQDEKASASLVGPDLLLCPIHTILIILLQRHT